MNPALYTSLLSHAASYMLLLVILLVTGKAPIPFLASAAFVICIITCYCYRLSYFYTKRLTLQQHTANRFYNYTYLLTKPKTMKNNLTLFKKTGGLLLLLLLQAIAMQAMSLSNQAHRVCITTTCKQTFTKPLYDGGTSGNSGFTIASAVRCRDDLALLPDKKQVDMQNGHSIIVLWQEKRRCLNK